VRSPNPRPSIVSAARNLSRKPALTEPGRPGGRPPHPPQAAAPRGRRNAARQARPRPGQAPARSRPGHRRPRPRRPLNRQAITGTGGLPAGTGQGWRKAPSPQETRRRSALDASRTAPGQSDAGSGEGTPATPGAKGQPAPKPGPPRQNPRPDSQHQAAESGQSQEPPPSEPDISSYTGTEQSPHSTLSHIRIIGVTCLYGNCPGIVRGSRNHLTNVVLAAEPVVEDPGDARPGGVDLGYLPWREVQPGPWPERRAG
jgi:hypothetical protein